MSTVVGWTYIISFFLVLIGFGQLKAGKRWGEILYYVALVPFAASVGCIVVGVLNG